MTSPQRRFHRFYLLVPLLLALTWLPPTPESNGLDQWRQLVPELPEDFARHLVYDDDAAFRAHVRRQSQGRVSEFRRYLFNAPAAHPVEEFVRVESLLSPHLDRVVKAMSSEFRLAFVAQAHQAYLRRPIPERMKILRINGMIPKVANRTGVSPEDKLNEYQKLIDEALKYQDVIHVGQLYWDSTALLPRLQRQQEMPIYLRRAVDHSLQYGDSATVCQVLGTLGYHYYHARGDVDSMRLCWDRGLQIARQARSWHEARLLNFYAGFHRTRGHLALARDLLLEAQGCARALGARDVEIRFCVATLGFFSYLECWDLVGRELERAEVLLREDNARWGEHDRAYWAASVNDIRAIYSSQAGQCETAIAVARDVRRHCDSVPPSFTSVHLAMRAAGVLLNCGHAQEARVILEEASRRAEAGRVAEVGSNLAISTARARFALGDLEGCEKSLREFADTTTFPHPPDQWLRYEIFSVKHALAASGSTAAAARLTSALKQLESMRGELDSGGESDLILANAEELRLLVHQIRAPDPATGYWFEMAWRQRWGSFDPLEVVGDGSLQLTQSTEVDRRAKLAWLASHDAVHCVYDDRGDKIIRWTAAGGAIREDTLDVESKHLETTLREVREALEAPVTGPVADELNRKLHDLAIVLLPEAILQARQRSLFLVSANGLLQDLAFETSSLSPTTYTPLLGRHDVAYLRGWRDLPPIDGSPAIVLHAPTYPMELRRRYPVLTTQLPHSATEIDAARRIFGKTVVMSGREASKSNLTSRWEDARGLYVAAHFVQDHQVPYASFLPLADSLANDSYLEITDIRNANLTGCELVVLSGCSSGRGYTARPRSSPGLGAAFVDAGARAVVQTLWSVEDQDAARLMSQFAVYYERDRDAARALAEARRRMIEQGVHPHVWGAYSVLLSPDYLPDQDPIVNRRAARVSAASPSSRALVRSGP